MTCRISTACAFMLAVAFVITGVRASFSQMPERPFSGGMQGRTGPGSSEPMAAGAVARIDESSIAIAIPGGQTQEFSRTGATAFVREQSIGRNALKKGGTLLVLGERQGDGSVAARIIKLISETGGGPQRPFSVENGPVIGEIIDAGMLRIRQASGAETSVQVTDQTLFFGEVPVNPSEVTVGSSVRIVAPGRPGSERKEAVKVVLSAAGRGAAGDGFEKSQPAKQVSQKLLPDIPIGTGQDFIYGIWIGRGLFTDEELERAFRVVDNLGVRYAKVEFKWDYVEKRDNEYQWNNQNTLDVEYVIRLAKQHRLSIIPYFDVFMPWAEIRREGVDCQGPPSRRGQYSAPSPAAYAEYVFNVIDKLKKGGVDVKFAELDNEPSANNDGSRSFNCLLNISAKQLKEAGNAAYDRIKAVYPDVMVSSSTFIFPGMSPGNPFSETFQKRTDSFIKAYFGEEPRPRFDFFGVHEVLPGSGNPFTTHRKAANAAYEYNLASYYEAYDIWRKILDSYGFKDKPIFNLESGAVQKGRQDAELIQRAVFARMNSGRNKVIGWVLSQLSGSKKFTERAFTEKGGGEASFSIGITRLADGYELREGYYGYYALMSVLARYPRYEGHELGELNSSRPWVEKFSNGQGHMLHVAFVPYGTGHTSPQSVSLQIGPSKKVRLTHAGASPSTAVAGSDGSLRLEVGENPVFIEELQ